MKHPLLLSELFLSLSIIVSAAVLGKPLDSFDDVDDVVDAVKSCGDHQECVLRHLCNDNGTIITDGRAIIDMRTASFSKESNQGCQWSEVCCSAGDKIVNSVEEYVSRGCGYSNPKGLQLTLQNTEQSEAQFGEFPWMISISEQICKNGVCTLKAQGGGSLLAPNVVLTTGHKIMNSSTDSLRVRAGEWDNLSTAEPYAHQDRQVARMILHPRFNRQVGFYDAALLILKTPFKLSPHIDTICLPSATDNFAHSRCIVTGWGRKTIDDPNYPNLLKKIELPYIERAKCQQQLRRTRLGRYFQLHSSFTCAGGEKDRDACLGDGGSPLVCPSKQGDPHHFVLAGIVSWGLECGQENVPGVYANVQALRPWIDQQLELIQ